jgi:competence ComEA-like helix-hairpin-helix protein
MEDRAGQVDLNAASVEALTQLSGIGPVLAQRIVDARPFADVDDLVRVQGIGPRTLERLRPALALSEGESAFPVSAPSSQAAGVAETGREGEPAAPDTSDRSSSTAPLEEIGPATFPVVAKAPETTLLPASEPKEPEEGLPVKERERAMGVPDTEAPEAEVIEAEVAETEVAEAEVTETEVAEAEVSEVEIAKEDILEAEVVEGDLAEAEPAEAEAFKVQGAEEGAASWETEPIPGFGEEEPLEEVAPQPQRPAVTRARVRWTALLSIVLATLLATLLSLAILSYVNGGQLQYVTPDHFASLSARAEGLEAQAGVLAQDVEGLRKRLDNLEALSGRLSTVEQAIERAQADLEKTAGEVEKLAAQANDLEAQAIDLAQQAEEVEARVGTLEAQGSRAQAFLEGLAELMNTLFPPEESTP